MARVGLCLLLVLGAWNCFHGAEYERELKFHVLHNWEGVYDVKARYFPPAHLSDIILQSLGIVQDFTWSGVTVGNVFQRPKASVLFVFDGDLVGSGLNAQASVTYQSEDTAGGPLGLVLESSQKVFKTIKDTFEEQSTAMLISVDPKTKDFVAKKDIVNKYCPKFVCLSDDGTFKVTANRDVTFDSTKEEDSVFLREILNVLGSTSKVDSASVKDGNPDVYIITLTSPKLIGKRCGFKSDEMNAVEDVLSDIVKEVSDDFVRLYEGRVLIQAISSSMPATSARSVRSVRHVREAEFDDTPATAGQLMNASDAKNLAPERSEEFSAMAAIFTTVVVIFVVALFGVSWILYSADPAKDTIIYRLVPTRQKME